LIFVALSGQELESRRSRREVFDNLSQIESHSTEAQVNSVLPQKADLIVDGRRSVEDIVTQVVQWVQERADFPF
jgi:hypothetical protein